MTRFEYRVIPAPTKGQKAKGLRNADARFANAMEQLLNQMAADGWEYDRAEFLPNEERAGLTGSSKTWRNILVFRRPVEDKREAPVPQIDHAAEPPLSAPAPVQPEPDMAKETGQVIPLTAPPRDGADTKG